MMVGKMCIFSSLVPECQNGSKRTTSNVIFSIHLASEGKFTGGGLGGKWLRLGCSYPFTPKHWQRTHSGNQGCLLCPILHKLLSCVITLGCATKESMLAILASQPALIVNGKKSAIAAYLSYRTSGWSHHI